MESPYPWELTSAIQIYSFCLYPNITGTESPMFSNVYGILRLRCRCLEHEARRAKILAIFSKTYSGCCFIVCV